MAFILSKLTWLFISPGNFLTLLILLAGFLCLSHNEARRHLGQRLCFTTALLWFLVAILPIGDWMVTPLENRVPALVPPEHVDGIILLGGDESPRLSLERGQPVMLQSAPRYMEFIELAKKYPDAKLLYSGGTDQIAPDTQYSQADVAKAELSALGVPAERLILEGKSRNTHENAQMSFDIVHPKPEENWLLVTSSWHMPRSLACFRKVGWHVTGAPVGYLTGGNYDTRLKFNLADHLTRMTLAAHEYYGLIAYRLLGFTDDIWPK